MWAAASGVLPAVAGLLSRMRAIDLAYQVRAGEDTLRTGDVVVTDAFTFTVPGAAWLNQQWGAQVLFASAHRALGWAGVAAAYAGSIGLGLSFLYRSCRGAGSRPAAAAVLTLLGFVVGAGSLGARPQALAVPLFTGTWLLLSRRDGWSWVVIPLAAVWANVHGSFVLAPLLAAFAVIEDLVGRRRPGGSVAIAIATALATFSTPFGPAVWGYALDVVRDETIRSSVAEWRPPSPLDATGATFWLSGVAVATVAFSRRTSVGAVDVVKLVVFFALGALAIRSTLWWALAAPAVVAGWAPATERADRALDGSPRDRATTAVVVLASIAVLALALGLRSGVDPRTGAPERLAWDAPETLAGAARRSLPPGARILVFQPYASWFEYSLPGHPVMVDSRIELFPDEVWREYDDAIVGTDLWPSVAEKYRIAGIVLPPRAVLADDLAASPDWRRVRTGPAGSLFVRR